MTILTESAARDEICRIGKSLFDRGYVHATAGNISVRLDASEGGGFLITPTDACLGSLDPARLARLDDQAVQTSGDRASKTIALHSMIYRAAVAFDAQTRCVIHTHSTHCVAVTLTSGHNAPGADATPAMELLPALTPYFVMKVGHVPVIPYHRPGDPLVASWVADVIEQYGSAGTPVRAVMLERLGPNVWHDSPAAAMAVLEELEETAKLWALCHTAGKPLPAALTEPQINELRQTFGARW
jgi:ribulose-5-phosphate 4-epimerase/fuculose-1-phosphate aldolase